MVAPDVISQAAASDRLSVVRVTGIVAPLTERLPMRVKFIHPVIVSGRKPDGSPRAELCRVESEFDVPEYSWDDAPVAMVATGLTSSSDYYHLHNGNLYIAFPDGKASGHFESGSALFYGLHNGSDRYVHFDPFHETVTVAAAKMEDEANLDLEVNVRRELLKRESKIGMREVTKACLNAPMLRNWSWLSSDVEQEVEHWRSVAAEKIGNVVMVRGVPCLRAFEPCYALNKTYGAPQIHAVSKRIYAKQVHKTDSTADGMEILGDGATFAWRHYFAASDFEGAVAFADVIGWKLLPEQKARINILNEAAVTDDFDTLETVRHAHLLLEATEQRHFGWELKNNAGQDTEFAAKLADFVADKPKLKDAVISWQNNKEDVDGLRRELASQTERALDCAESARRRPGSCSPILFAVSQRQGPGWEITGQLEQFLVRSDQADISLDIPLARGPGV